MTEAPILAHPDYDKPFILYTDASYSGLGCILAQKGEDGKEHVILYGRRKLQSAEQNYTITELECLGVVWSVHKNKQFFGQNNFLLFTDHKALETLRKQALPSISRRTRWILELEQYNYTINHHPGKKMPHVDYLSRYPISNFDQDLSQNYTNTNAVTFNDEVTEIFTRWGSNNNNLIIPTTTTTTTTKNKNIMDPWEEYPEQSPIWSEVSSNRSQPPSKWEEKNFTYMGRWQQCQSPDWNPKYHLQSGSCQMEGHHTHYYCRYCKYNYNPFGWWKKPTEDEPCDCGNANDLDSDNESFSDPDEALYEESWNPSYRSEEEPAIMESETIWWQPTISVQERTPQEGVEKIPLATTPWWEIPIMVMKEERMDHSIETYPSRGPAFVLL